MKKKSTERAGTLSPTWETLEAFARQGMQQFLQRMLEAEVDELLARARYERHGPVDAPGGYRNGFGKPRRLSLSNGTIVLRRPRVRGLAERFESRLLPAFKCRTEEGGRLLPEQYLHGLAQGDFDRALRGLLGDGAPLSAPSIARLKAGWQAEYELWKTPGGCRPRGRLPLGGRGVREGRTREGQGGDARGPGGIARRAEGNPRVREWLSGIDRGLGHDPARPQAAWVARPQARDRRRAPRDLGRAGRGVPGGQGAAVRESSAPEHPGQVAAQAAGRGPDGRGQALQEGRDATAVIWKTLLIAEKTFRRLDAPELLADVANDVVYVNGVRPVNRGDKKAAA